MLAKRNLNCEKFFLFIESNEYVIFTGYWFIIFLCIALSITNLLHIMFMDLQMYKNHDSTSPYIPNIETGLYTLMIINSDV